MNKSEEAIMKSRQARKLVVEMRNKIAEAVNELQEELPNKPCLEPYESFVLTVRTMLLCLIHLQEQMRSDNSVDLLEINAILAQTLVEVAVASDNPPAPDKFDA